MLCIFAYHSSYSRLHTAVEITKFVSCGSFHLCCKQKRHVVAGFHEFLITVGHCCHVRSFSALTLLIGGEPTTTEAFFLHTLAQWLGIWHMRSSSRWFHFPPLPCYVTTLGRFRVLLCKGNAIGRVKAYFHYGCAALRFAAIVRDSL